MGTRRIGEYAGLEVDLKEATVFVMPDSRRVVNARGYTLGILGNMEHAVIEDALRWHKGSEEVRDRMIQGIVELAIDRQKES